MKLKDIWKDKVDGVDDVLAKDINDIAHATIQSETDIQKNQQDINDIARAAIQSDANIQKNQQDIGRLTQSSEEFADLFQVGTNLYDESKATVGKVLEYHNNKWKDDANYNTSDYIPVSVGDVLTAQRDKGVTTERQTFNFGMVVAYDSNLNFLGQAYGAAGVASYTVPEGVAYIRVSLAANSAHSAIVRGTDILPYEPYKMTLKPEHHDDEHINDLIDEKVGDLKEDTDKLEADLLAFELFSKKITQRDFSADVAANTTQGIKGVKIPANIPSGKMCTVKIIDSNNIIKQDAYASISQNSLNDGWLSVKPNASGSKFTSQDITHFSIYVASSNVVEDGILTFEISYVDENPNSLENRIEAVENDVANLKGVADKQGVDLSALNSLVKKEISYSWGFDVSVGTTTGIKSNVPHPVNIPNGKMCTVTITDNDNIIKTGASISVGENTANGWLGVPINTTRSKMTDTDVSNISLYLSSSNVVSDGVIKFEISYTDENPDSLEGRVEALENNADNNGGIRETLNEHLSAENPHAITAETLGLGLATVAKSGLMSHTDKQKLDNLIGGGGNITIEGSGVTKNASAFGFLPTNDAETNSIALQNALNGGGTILVDLAGVYEVCKTIYLDSNTTIIFGSNVFLKKGVNANGVHATYTFINRGAFTGDTNENIKIIGLHLLTDGLGGGTDVKPIVGQRGHLAFYHIKNLRIEDFELTDGTDAGWYNIHIQDFDDIHLENIKIISQKDGIHLGSGKNFVIKHCSFLTNDDAIALNAHDYPTGTSCLGWIENGIIEDIHFLGDTSYREGRGIYMLGGSWVEWESGLSFRTYGDACVSNGRIYRTTGTIVQSPFEFKVSTVRPDFASGQQTLADGLTWTMVQDYKVCYDAGVRNVVIRDIYMDRMSSAVLTMNLDDDQFSRSYYPTSNPPVFKNIKLENVVMEDNCVNNMASIYVPVKNLKFVNCQYNVKGKIVSFLKEEMASFKNDMLLDGTYFELTENNNCLIWARYGIPVDVKIVNSMGNIDHAKTVNGTEINIIANDIGL